MKEYPTQEELKELFDYHPDGYLVWKTKGTNVNKKRKGKKLGTYWFNTSAALWEYDCIINKQKYKGARLIWIYHNGEIEKGHQICRINKMDRPKIENLTSRINAKLFQSKIPEGTSIYRGVYKRLDCAIDAWRVEFEGKSLGTYSCEVHAARAYDLAAFKKYGELVYINGIDKTINPEDRRIKRNSNRSISNQNRGKQSNFIGVSKVTRKKGTVWTVKCRKKHIGCFKTQEEAARAYNIAAYKHYGENAVLNDIPDPLGSGF